MGLETIALASLAVGAAQTVYQAAQARKAARAQREARDISTAGQTISDRAARRRAVREARIRRAMIESSAVVSNAGGSSGEFGAGSALTANVGASIANQTSDRLGAQGISAANQRSADAQSRFDTAGQFGQLIQGGLSLWDEASKPLGT